jgi:hypothetical protein
MVQASVALGQETFLGVAGRTAVPNESRMPCARSLTLALRPSRTVVGVRRKEVAVLDLLMIAMTVVFFALAFLFMKGLERV